MSFTVTSSLRTAIEDYFQLGFDLDQALASFPQDEWLARALSFAPGLRILRQDPWETLASFICSAVKQIVQIQAINESLRRNFGPEVEPDLFAFPDYSVLAKVGRQPSERANSGSAHVTSIVQPVNWWSNNQTFSAWHQLPTPELKLKLLAFPGLERRSLIVSSFSPMDDTKPSPSISGSNASLSSSIFPAPAIKRPSVCAHSPQDTSGLIAVMPSNIYFIGSGPPVSGGKGGWADKPEIRRGFPRRLHRFPQIKGVTEIHVTC